MSTRNRFFISYHYYVQGGYRVSPVVLSVNGHLEREENGRAVIATNVRYGIPTVKRRAIFFVLLFAIFMLISRGQYTASFIAASAVMLLIWCLSFLVCRYTALGSDIQEELFSYVDRLLGLSQYDETTKEPPLT